jgi:hypothetical protein
MHYDSGTLNTASRGLIANPTIGPGWMNAKLTLCVRTSTFLKLKRILTLLDIRWVCQSSKNNEHFQVLPLLNGVYLPLYLPLRSFGYGLLRVHCLHPCRSEYPKEFFDTVWKPGIRLVLLSVSNSSIMSYSVFLKPLYEFLAFTSVSDMHGAMFLRGLFWQYSNYA